MAIESDGETSLPKPPLPRPARRQAAIETALRKFDGVEEESGRPARTAWAASHRYQLGGLVTAALVAAVAIPTVLVVMREQPPTAAPETSAPTVLRRDSSQAQGSAAPPAVVPEGRATQQELPQSASPPAGALVADERRSDAPVLAREQQTSDTALADFAAAAPPTAAPPPPPPPAAASRNEEAAVQADEIVLTGTRIRQPNLSKQRNKAASPQREMAGYESFLSSLQAAVRGNDRRAIIALVAFPLSVNQAGRTRTYRSAEAVERDFERIFTSRVKRAILSQSADQLFVRDQGAMIGDGEVWFDRSCRNSDCSAAGPVRILGVNP